MIMQDFQSSQNTYHQTHSFPSLYQRSEEMETTPDDAHAVPLLFDHRVSYIGTTLLPGRWDPTSPYLPCEYDSDSDSDVDIEPCGSKIITEKRSNSYVHPTRDMQQNGHAAHTEELDDPKALPGMQEIIASFESLETPPRSPSMRSVSSGTSDATASLTSPVSDDTIVPQLHLDLSPKILSPTSSCASAAPSESSLTAYEELAKKEVNRKPVSMRTSDSNVASMNTGSRKVQLADLPPGTPLWILLSRVGGGALEYVRYDSRSGTATIVFLLARAAQEFYEYMYKNGLYLPTIDAFTKVWGAPFKKVTLLPYDTRITDDDAYTPGKTIKPNASRCLLLYNVPPMLEKEILKQKIMEQIKGYFHVPSRPEEVFETFFYAGYNSNGVEYRAIENGEVTEPRKWYKYKDKKAIIARFSSILIAMAATAEIKGMPEMENVEIGFVEDHCINPLPRTRSAKSPEEAAHATMDVLKRTQSRGVGAAPASSTYEKRQQVAGLSSNDTETTPIAGSQTYTRNSLSVVLSDLPMNVVHAHLYPIIRGGNVLSLQLVRSGDISQMAWVQFTTPSAAQAYLTFSRRYPIYLQGRELVVFPNAPRHALSRVSSTVTVIPGETRIVRLQYLRHSASEKGLEKLFYGMMEGRMWERITVHTCDEGRQGCLVECDFKNHYAVATVELSSVDKAKKFIQTLDSKMIGKREGWTQVKCGFAEDFCARGLEEIHSLGASF